MSTLKFQDLINVYYEVMADTLDMTRFELSPEVVETFKNMEEFQHEQSVPVS